MKSLKIAIIGILCLCFSISQAQFKSQESRVQSASHPALNTMPDWFSQQMRDRAKNLASEDIQPFTPKSLQYVQPTAHNSLQKNALFIRLDDRSALLNEVEVATRAEEVFAAQLNHLINNQYPTQVKSIKTEQDFIGYWHVTGKQYYREVPLYAGDILLHGTQDGFYLINGKIQTLRNPVSTEPVIGAEEVESFIEADLGVKAASFDRLPVDFKTPKPELVIYNTFGTSYLVWHTVFFTNAMQRWVYFVDAIDGSIIDSYLDICALHMDDHCSGHTEKTEIDLQSKSASSPGFADGPAVANAFDLHGVNRTINTYDVGGDFLLIDASRDMFNSQNSGIPNDPQGAIWTLSANNTSPENESFTAFQIVSPNNQWNRPAAVSAHYNAGVAYDYFESEHNHISIDGNEGTIISFIDIKDADGDDLDNAFWNGIGMFYGNGESSFYHLAGALDVAGHEMTHGVIQRTANMEYRNEPGALNESFADVFGAMMDRQDWLIGEDVVKPGVFPGGALRNMQDPHNGGNILGDNGWQPKFYSERFTGSQDNGGVHINSGIANYAFFLFASDVGKDMAERVYFRALKFYLTRSSTFVDCRLAVQQAAKDLFGASAETAAKEAFDTAGFPGGAGGGHQEDFESNPGDDFILMTDNAESELYLFDTSGEQLSTPDIPLIGPDSKPSITDDGEVIVFTTTEGEMYAIIINWDIPAVVDHGVIDASEEWLNVAISLDGSKIAAIRNIVEPFIYVYDFDLEEWESFELYNPTYTEGVQTGDVEYADFFEFSHTGEYIMYDAFNQLDGNFGEDISYWDIGFLHIFNNQSNGWANGDVDKLIPALPEGISIGNPSFSRNSDYIITFDYLDSEPVETEFVLVAANIETGDLNGLFLNNGLSYPSYSRLDDFILFDYVENDESSIAALPMAPSKIQASDNAFIFVDGGHWARWFSNGDRLISDVLDLEKADAITVEVYPNPVKSRLKFRLPVAVTGDYTCKVIDSEGKLLQSAEMRPAGGDQSIDVSNLVPGTYFLVIENNGVLSRALFFKG